jgi:hypothetical protein
MHPELQFIRTRLCDVIKDDDAVSPQDQRALAALRTDLNIFSNHEITQLIADGYTHARSAFRDAGFYVEKREPFVDFFPSVERHDLSSGSKTPINLWNWKDPYSYFNLLLICAFIVEVTWIARLALEVFNHGIYLHFR